MTDEVATAVPTALSRKGSGLFQSAMDNAGVVNVIANGARSRGNRPNNVPTGAVPQAPTHRPDPRPKGQGAVGSALSGLMADLDNQVNRVKQVALSAQPTQPSLPQQQTNTSFNSRPASKYEQPAPMMKHTRSMIFGKKKPAVTSLGRDEEFRDPRLGPRVTREMVFGRRPGDAPTKLTRDMVFGDARGAPLPALNDGVIAEGPNIRCVEATYDFEAERHDELSFRRGDVVFDVVDKDADWLVGWIRGKKGAFPRGFAEDLPVSSTRNGGLWKAKWKFDAEMADEMSFPVGAMIEALEDKDREWAWGSYKGTRGVVPKDYLVKSSRRTVTPVDARVQNDVGLDVQTGVKSALDAAAAVEQATMSLLKLQDKYGSSGGRAPLASSSSGIPMRAVADFIGERSDELTFARGDTVVRLRSHDSDWDIGVCNGIEGMYPKSFVR